MIMMMIIADLVTDAKPSDCSVSETVALFATLLIICDRDWYLFLKRFKDNLGYDMFILISFGDDNDGDDDDDISDSRADDWRDSNREVCKSRKSFLSLVPCSRTALLKSHMTIIHLVVMVMVLVAFTYYIL